MAVAKRFVVDWGREGQFVELPGASGSLQRAGRAGAG